MSHPRALITGGCGFVGRHFVKWLLNHDYHVTIVDDLSTGLLLQNWPAHLRVPDSKAHRITFHNCDFRDFTKNASANFDLIIHLAAVVGGRLTIEGDPIKVATDLAIDATLFNWVVKERTMPRKVLYFSSSAAYPIKEQTASNNRLLFESMIDLDKKLDLPDMTYGWAKLTGEFLAKFAAQKYGLNVAIYRPFSGYGEDQDFTYPFPSVIRRVARRESPIVVWGSGNQLRDFIYIDNVIEAVFASESRLQPGEVLNLGSGVGTSFRQLAQTACKVIGHKTDIINDSSKPEGVFARVANCDRMFQFYHPTITLESGIQIVYDYQRSANLLE